LPIRKQKSNGGFDSLEFGVHGGRVGREADAEGNQMHKTEITELLDLTASTWSWAKNWIKTCPENRKWEISCQAERAREMYLSGAERVGAWG
jgi:hypothetical protein